MIPFIATAIKQAREVSLLEGQAKYRAYFIRTERYAKYKDGVDEILIIDGQEDCIVTA